MTTKGHCYPKSIILQAVYFKLRFTVSYRDVEEIMKIPGVHVDHAIIQRWVFKFTPFIESAIPIMPIFSAQNNGCLNLSKKVVTIDAIKIDVKDCNTVYNLNSLHLDFAEILVFRNTMYHDLATKLQLVKYF